ncbi:hypothetical protein FHR32_005919 [Streptosporangium album]|uniref:Uncharacterized protein n=1 Tax=Streptosporangium album TaxID=47479 RepID=A0A7W7S0Y0_9ACTN|nr:hypothetical protein [Streptosporangium album]
MRQLQKEPVLRIPDLRLPDRHTEERGVEPLMVVQHHGGRHEVRIVQRTLGHAERPLLLTGETGERLDSVGEIAPELPGVSGSRHPARKADDRDRLHGGFLGHAWVPFSLPEARWRR